MFEIYFQWVSDSQSNGNSEKRLISNTNQPYLSRKLIYSKERLLQIIKSQNRLETRACENFHLNLLLLNSKFMDVTFLH